MGLYLDYFLKVQKSQLAPEKKIPLGSNQDEPPLVKPSRFLHF